MNEIKCPHCGKAFKVDEAGYADILKQVRNSEFEQQLHERLELAEKDKLNAVELAKNKVGNEMQKAAAVKDAEIQDLKAKLGTNEVVQKLAITEAVSAVEKERDELKNGLRQAELEKQLSEKSLKDKYETQIKDRDDAIERLREMGRTSADYARQNLRAVGAGFGRERRKVGKYAVKEMRDDVIGIERQRGGYQRGGHLVTNACARVRRRLDNAVSDAL